VKVTGNNDKLFFDGSKILNMKEFQISPPTAFMGAMKVGEQVTIKFKTAYTKNKIQLNAGVNIDRILQNVQKKYKKQPINTEDGLKIEFDGDWVHLRKSNTEPIIRIYSESQHETTANNLAQKIMQDIMVLMKEG
jgi:phosphomannomutase